MRKFAVVVLALWSVSTSAGAVTFNPSIPNTIDFGTVQTGTTKTIAWEIGWVDGTPDPWRIGYYVSSYTSYTWEFHTKSTGCTVEGGICKYEITFKPWRPSLEGLSREVLALCRSATNFCQPTLFYTLSLLGRGEGQTFPPPPRPPRDPTVPIPGALPLFATGILGLIAAAKLRKGRKGTH